MKITLITTAQPSTNPRLVKEANALAETGYEVMVLYCYRTDWAIETDKSILETAKWDYKLVGGTPYKKKIRYQWTRIRRRLSATLSFMTPFLKRANAQAYDELLCAAKKTKADLYIAHNPGALAIAAAAARSNHSQFSFDAEDFHSGEQLDGHPLNEQMYKLQKMFLKKAAYISAASPLIAKELKSTFLLDILPTTINNVFSIRLQQPLENKSNQKSLKLFWFSQTLGSDRGIEEVITAFQHIPEVPIELTLLGKSNKKLKKDFLKLIEHPSHRIVYLEPRSEKALLEVCAHADIGLALERKIPLNRDICLTNKLFTYLLSGCALVCSSTRAQSHFMDTNKDIGFVYTIGDYLKIAKILKRYWNEQDLLRQHQKNAWNLARNELNWEVEREKLYKKIRDLRINPSAPSTNSLIRK